MTSIETRDPETPAPEAPEPFLLAREVADLLCVSRRWVMDKATSGALPCHRLPDSNRTRFLRSEILAAMTTNTHPSTDT